MASLKDKILDPAVPVKFFELVPAAADKPAAIEAAMEELRKVRQAVDAINLPEIHDEDRGAPRTAKFVERLEPRVLGERIQREVPAEVVVNRGVVYEPDQLAWFRSTVERFGIRNLVLVGGDSAERAYPGPSVIEAARQVREAGLDACLGGITIPSRLHEDERIRAKHAAGLEFFTSQILFDSNDIVWLIQKLNGLEARIVLSFAPVCHPRDLEFLRWLGADIPADIDRFLLHGGAPPTSAAPASPQATTLAPAGSASPHPETCLARSLDLAQRILMDVFDNLPPDPPAIGLNVEHINQRNFRPAMRMLERLGALYSSLVAARGHVYPSGGPW